MFSVVFTGGSMERREFLVLLGGTTVAWPFAAHAQQPGKIPTIGLLSASTTVAERPRNAAFVQRLGELGWAEGRNVKIEYRAAQGVAARASEVAAEFVRLNVDVIVSAGDAQVLAIKKIATTTPIVIAVAGDPVANGLVASLARPGGNVTGLSAQINDTAGKRVELLHELVPSLRRLAILGNFSNPAVAIELQTAQASARAFGIETSRLEIRNAEDIAAVMAQVKGSADALYVCVDPLVIANRAQINTRAFAAGLPTMHSYPDNLEGGGLIAFGPDLLDLYRRAAGMVDKILRGAKPADIPVEQPTKFGLTINLKIAKALGLDIPPALLARADDVIE